MTYRQFCFFMTGLLENQKTLSHQKCHGPNFQLTIKDLTTAHIDHQGQKIEITDWATAFFISLHG